MYPGSLQLWLEQTPFATSVLNLPATILLNLGRFTTSKLSVTVFGATGNCFWNGELCVRTDIDCAFIKWRYVLYTGWWQPTHSLPDECLKKYRSFSSCIGVDLMCYWYIRRTIQFVQQICCTSYSICIHIPGICLWFVQQLWCCELFNFAYDYPIIIISFPVLGYVLLCISFEIIPLNKVTSIKFKISYYGVSNSESERCNK